MPPLPLPPHDSDDERSDELLVPVIDDDDIDDELEEIMTLNENDEQPTDIGDLAEDMTIEDDGQVQNGYIPDDSIMMFQQHDGSVFSVALSPTDQHVAVSGGEDDNGYVWNTRNGEILLNCDGHKDSVISCSFNADGKYVMTADMSGTVIVRNVHDGKTVWDYECTDLEWCFWHGSINVLFAGSSDGEVYMWKVPSGDCKIYQGHGSKPLEGKLTANGKELLVVYEDGTLKLWDLKTANARFTYNGQDETFLCAATQPSGNLVACGTANGCTKIFGVTAAKLVASLQAPATSTSDEDGKALDRNIECIAFSPTEQYIAAGSLDGTLQIWDVATHRLRHTCQHPSGVTRLLWYASDPHVITTACLDGTLRLWDYRSGELVRTFQGHQEGILDFCVSSDGKTFLTAGDDHCVRVFEK